MSPNFLWKLILHYVSIYLILWTRWTINTLQRLFIQLLFCLISLVLLIMAWHVKYDNAQDITGPCATGLPSLRSLRSWTPLCFSLFFLFGRPSLAPFLGGHIPLIRGWEILPSFSLMKPCSVSSSWERCSSQHGAPFRGTCVILSSPRTSGLSTRQKVLRGHKQCLIFSVSPMC